MPDPFGRLTYEGHTLDHITLAAFQHGADILGATPPMVQGCYSTAVAASGNTHAGSGAFDLEPPDGHTHDQLVRAYRWAGTAIWHRLRLVIDGKLIWEEHDHAIVVGDPRASQAGLNQVHDYHADLDGLAGHDPDGTWHPNPILPFHYPLGRVNLAHVHEQATVAAKKKTSITGVKHIQRCLNLKRQAALAVDGVFGPKTKAAYKRWELQVGGDGDGIPGAFALKLLGASQFSVENQQ